MRNIKKIISSLAILSAVALLGACTANKNTTTDAGAAGNGKFRTLDEIKESKTINIGVFSDKHPFGYVDEEGKYQGYDIYLAERLGKDLGVNINYVST